MNAAGSRKARRDGSTEHGVRGRQPTDILERAYALLSSQDIDGAWRACSELRSWYPDHPSEPLLRATCERAEGRPEDAVRTVLAALRTSNGDVAASLWSELSLSMIAGLAPLEAEFVHQQRLAHERWKAEHNGSEAAPAASVTAVLAVPARTDRARATIGSLRTQQHGDLEIIVIHDGSDAAIAEEIATLRDVVCRVVELVMPGAREIEMLNAGVRAAGGDYINPLVAGHELAPDRIVACLRDIAGPGRLWGYSSYVNIDPAGEVMRPDAGTGMLSLAGLSDRADSDPDSFALIDREFAPGGVGGLFFRRELFDRLQGFRGLPLTYAWDFCLRAVALEEPVRIVAPLYRHLVELAGRNEPRSRAQAAAAKLAVFREYFAQALNETWDPANRFAPCLRHWRTHFLARIFACGYVLAVPVERLEAMAAAIAVSRRASVASKLAPGIGFVGFPQAPNGLGESMRSLVRAGVDAGLPCVAMDVDWRFGVRQLDRGLGHLLVDQLQHRAAIFCVNPDALRNARPMIEGVAAAGGYRIGWWAWELEQVPRAWNYAFEWVEEIWVATEFVADAMRRATSRPVVRIPQAIAVARARDFDRSEFGLPEGDFLFLFSFDFNSYVERKNPAAVIAAFRKAFPAANERVGLVIKSSHGSGSEKYVALQGLAEGDARIRLLHEVLTRAQSSGLQSVVDAYVSLHRAEGFGLGLAESMYQGKPVIGTGYSGNLDFMTADNSCLVDYRLIPVQEGEYAYQDERFRWADPDIDHAAFWMRRLVADPGFRERIAARGRDDVRARHSLANAGSAIRMRLERLGLL